MAKSKLKGFFERHKAQPARPDMVALSNGTGDLRDALGISHLGENVPVAYFLFHNSDEGPAQRYWDEAPEAFRDSEIDVNGIEAGVNSWDEKEAARCRSAFDIAHYRSIASEPSRATTATPLAMAFALKSARTFDRVLSSVSRAFMADTVNSSDLTLTVFYLPALVVGPASKREKPVRVVLSPDLAPLQAAPTPTLREYKAEPALHEPAGRTAYTMTQQVLRKLARNCG